ESGQIPRIPAGLCTGHLEVAEHGITLVDPREFPGPGLLELFGPRRVYRRMHRLIPQPDVLDLLNPLLRLPQEAQRLRRFTHPHRPPRVPASTPSPKLFVR